MPSQDTRRVSTKYGLRFKIAGVTSLALLLMGVLLGYLSLSSSRDILQREIQKRGRALAGSLAKNGDYALFANNKKDLREFTKGVLAQEDVAYVFIVDAKSKRIVVSGANARDGVKDIKSMKADEDFVGPADMKGTYDPLKLDPDQVKEVTVRTDLERADVGHLMDVAAPIFYRVNNKDDSLLFGGDDTAEADDTIKKEDSLQRIGHVQVGFYLKATEQEIRNTAVRSFGIVLLLLIGAVLIVIGFVRFAVSPVERMAQVAIKISGGDLRQEVAHTTQDEMGQLASAFNDMLKSIRGMLSQMREASENIESSTNEILTAATQQSAGASEQAASISETGATVKEISQTASQTADKANSVIDISQRSEQISVVGQRAVEDSIAGIEELRGQVEAIAQNIIELSERTQQIGEIITTVNDLAEQSNLLALNASIEAAKAGEQGKGFAVVAVEMRNLAEQSKQATAQVRTILSDIQRATRAAVAVTEEGSRKAETSVQLANTSGENIRSLAQVIKESSLAAKQIAALASQQSVGIEQISTAMTNIKQSTSESVAGTKQIERALQDLKSLSDRLSSIVNRYEM